MANSSRKTGTNESISTGGDNARDYDLSNGELTNWEQATDYDLVTATTSEVLEIYDDDPSFDDDVMLDGATTSSSYFRIIRPADGEGHNGTPNSGVFFSSTAGNNIFRISENYSSVQDLIGKLTINTVTAQRDCFSIYNCDEASIVGCIAVDCTNAGGGRAHGFRIYPNNAGYSGYAINCLCTGVQHHGFRCDAIPGTAYFYNCTSVNNGTGFSRTASNTTVICKNCIATGNSTEDWYEGSGDAYPITKTTCTDEGEIVAYANEGNDDYHLIQEGFLNYIGTDLSSDAYYAFDDDIDGDTRDRWWCGFDEYTGVVSCRRVGVNENVSTGGNNTRDYDLSNGELTNWEQATDYDLVTAATSEVLECYDDDPSFDDDVILEGATTNASYFRIIRPADGEGHDGTPNNGVYLLTTTATHLFSIREDYSQIQDLIGSLSRNTSIYNSVFNIYNCSEAAYVGCLVDFAFNSGAGQASGFQFYDTTDCFAVNCLANNCDTVGFRTMNSGNGIFLNCTSYDCDYGFVAGASTTLLGRNCLGANSGTDDFYESGGTLDLENCASEDDTADDFGGTGNRASQTFSFVYVADDDFHLASTDAGARTYGADLSSYTDYPFDDDIDKETRTLWDIGMDQYIESILFDMSININNSWKDVEEVKINISSSWKDVSEIKINSNCDWKSV